MSESNDIGAAWYLVAALGVATLMIIHELGHFLSARAYGMRVTRFSIGFGPTFFRVVPEDGYFWFTTAADKIRIRLFEHVPEKHGPTVYQVGMIPFLAYVQIAGMNPLDDIEPEDKGSYANAKLGGRVVTIFGGPFANYLFSSVFIFASFFFGGRPFLSTQVNVLPERPAALEAKLQDGDRILSIAGTEVSEWEDMANLISSHPGETVDIVVERNGERIATRVTPANESGHGKIGVSPGAPATRVPVTAKDAALRALVDPPMLVQEQVVQMGKFLTGEVEGELTGPVGITKQVAKVAERGWTDLLYVLGVFSALLGAFNLMPIPGLDGGRLMFLGYEAVMRRRPNARIEAGIHTVGIVMMLALMLWVTANDIGLGGLK